MNCNWPIDKVASEMWQVARGGILSRNYPWGMPHAVTPDTSLSVCPDSQGVASPCTVRCGASRHRRPQNAEVRASPRVVFRECRTPFRVSRVLSRRRIVKADFALKRPRTVLG